MRGITPVVALILLVIIVIVITGFSFGIFSNVISTTSQEAEESLEQQTYQAGILYSIEGVDKNKVFLRNVGANNILGSGLRFYVNDGLVEFSGPTELTPGQTGTFFLNDSKLAMMPDPASLKVTGGPFDDSREICFYCNYYVGYWNFDEGSGLTTKDESDNSNNGILEDTNDINGDGDTPPTWVSGLFENALHFDGKDDQVNVVDHISQGLTDALTIQGWIKFDSIKTHTLVMKNSAYGFRIYGGELKVGLWGPTGVVNINSTGVFNQEIGSWHHFTVTWDGLTDIVTFYVDGEPFIADGSFTESLRTTNNPLLIGKVSWGEGSTTEGVIDDVRVINVARSMTTS